MQRLTIAQYHNSIQDIFGPQIQPDAPLEEDETTAMFSSIGAAHVGTSERGIEQYRAAAFDIATQVFEHRTDYEILATCVPEQATDPCIRDFIRHFGSRLWRRPMTQEEIDRYAGLVGSPAEEGLNLDLGMRYALAALIESPNFIYVPSIGEPDPNSGFWRYTSYEMASRLSYFLWNSTPDDELLAAAERDELVGTDGLAEQALRMLETERGQEVAARFFTESWRVTALDINGKNPEMFPDWNAQLLDGFREEFRLFFHDLLENDRDLRDVFTANRTYADATLAAWYGLEVPAAPGFEEIGLDETRSGILTSGAVLAANSPSDRTSPTRRGAFLLDSIFCLTVPPPPPNVNDVLPEDPPGEEPTTARQKLEQHVSDPVCAGCHQLIDPLGFALEHYDAIGAYRTEELPGVPVDAVGQLNDATLDGAIELAEFVAADERAASCIASRLLSYAAGREPTADDAVAVERLLEDLKANDYRFRALVTALVTEPMFRYTTEPQ
jgi:hypothetical protein